MEFDAINLPIHDDAVLRGSERLEFVSTLGRSLRQGSPDALKVSDADRVRDAFRARDWVRAQNYLRVLHGLYDGMTASYLEWSYMWAATLAAHAPVVDERAATARAHLEWKAIITGDQTLGHNAVAARIAVLLGETTPASASEFQANAIAGRPTAVADIQAVPSALYEALWAATDRGDCDSATATFEKYLIECRTRHDLLAEYVSTYGRVVLEMYGQAVCEATTRESLTGCLMYAGLWTLVKTMTPIEVAAFLAEHLRAHFSGPAREGSVEIIDEGDCYRLVLSPCGSGQAMRLRERTRPHGACSTLPQGSPATWGLPGQVPSYCTHCAMNELESVDRLGYPLLVTQFNPNPEVPCGWTIYKDPASIPEQYFTRIGARRDPSRFIRTGHPV
jgi:hypothetical protein